MKRAEQAVPILFSGGAGRGKRPGTPASRRGACDLDDCLGLSAFVQLVPPEPRPARMRPSFRGRTVRGEHAQPVSRGFRPNSLPRRGDRHGAMPDRPLDRRRLFGPRGRFPMSMAPTGPRDRLLAGVPGDEIGRGKIGHPESSAALAANDSGFFLHRAPELASLTPAPKRSRAQSERLSPSPSTPSTTIQPRPRAGRARRLMHKSTTSHSQTVTGCYM